MQAADTARSRQQVGNSGKRHEAEERLELGPEQRPY
jgi:hypothetical protein